MPSVMRCVTTSRSARIFERKDIEQVFEFVRACRHAGIREVGVRNVLFALRPCVGDTAAPTPREATLDNSLDPLESALTEVAAIADVADRRPRGHGGEQPRLLSAGRGRVRQGTPVHRQIHELLTPEDADVGDLRGHVARQFALQRDVELVERTAP